MVVSESNGKKLTEPRKTCLNPCFDGWWYRSPYQQFGVRKSEVKVLILVLMDGGIGD